jgi:hypothetical protein
MILISQLSISQLANDLKIVSEALKLVANSSQLEASYKTNKDYYQDLKLS